MAFEDRYRQSADVEELISTICSRATRRWRIMEICGGQTHAILRTGIDQRLASVVSLVHGPGCPVCVTSPTLIDDAIALSMTDGVTLCSFGDMMRVPGTQRSLREARALGGTVAIVYSPLDALEMARRDSEREFVFLAIGFETTAPTVALAILIAASERLKNFSVLSSHLLVPPALVEILGSDDVRVEGVLAAGHVCSVMGFWEYDSIAEKFRIPIVVTGFEPVDLLTGIYQCIMQLEKGESRVENGYQRAVDRGGNKLAQDAMSEVFEVGTQSWRGFGSISASGLRIRPSYGAYDAQRRFTLSPRGFEATSECISGAVLRGVSSPIDCPAFGTRCTPDHPLGATMVSDEGVCAAYMNYRWRNQHDDLSARR